MANNAGLLAWKLMVELRKELVESQKIRTQIIGFKITFVSTEIGLVVAHLEKVPAFLLIIAPFAAVFFDLIIISYSFSIKRIGFYIRNNIESLLKTEYTWPSDVPLWEEFMERESSKQRLSYWGNFGITALATAIGIAGLVMPADSALALKWQVVLIVILLALIAIILLKGNRQFNFDMSNRG